MVFVMRISDIVPLTCTQLQADDDGMEYTEALREVFSHKTQTVIAAELSALGLPCDQTKVSAWMRGRVPTIEQLAIIEDWAGLPRGWVLARSGYGNIPGVKPVSSSGASLDQLRARVAELTERVERLAELVAQHDGQLASQANRAAPTRRQSAQVH